MISCLMPAYNSSAYLAEAIQTLLDQTYKDFELIIQDDGSTDSTYELIKYFSKDKRVKYFRNPKNMGIAYTRNKAFSHSGGEYIAVCDSDDIYHPSRLKRSLRAIQKADIVYSPILNAYEDGKVFGVTDPPSGLTVELLRQDQQIPHQTIMARRKCFEEHPYDNSFRSNDDLKLIYEWFLAGYTWKKIGVPLTIHRTYPGSVSNVKRKEVAKFGKIARKFFEEGLCKK